MRLRVLKIGIMVSTAMLGLSALPAVADPISAQQFYSVAYGDYGRAEFDNYGEHLRACDTNPDNRDVNAILTVQGVQYVASDNGAGGDCGHRDLTLDENLPGRLQVCIVGIGCRGKDIIT